MGHSHPKAVKALRKQISRGASFGTITENELELAKLIVDNIPHIERIRFVNSGTEAVMTAIRLARAVTGKNLIIKFDGCYHGHTDSMLVAAGSGLITQNEQTTNSGGLTHSLLKETLVLPLNNEDELRNIFKKYGDQIACAIIEPMPANSGLLPQRKEFLKELEILCKENKALLIFDEVITGFRLGFSGFSGKYGFTPDIVAYGKIIGGGLPIGAIAGKQKWLDRLAPQGKVYQAGTLSGNPLAMSVGKATLSYLLENDVYAHLKNLSDYLADEFQNNISPIFEKCDFTISLVREESIFWLCVHKKEMKTPIRKADQIWARSSEIYKKIFWSLIDHNIYTAPSAYEVSFLSYPMKQKNTDQYIHSLKKAIGLNT